MAEGVRYYKKTGIFPINHGMVVRREIAEKHPWIVLNLLKAYDKANEIANANAWSRRVSRRDRAGLGRGAAHAARAPWGEGQSPRAGDRRPGRRSRASTPRRVKLDGFAPSALEQ